MIQKRAMAGQKIPLWHKLRNGLRIYRGHRTNAWGGADAYRKRYNFLVKLLNQYTGRSVKDSRVLEIGCGQRAAMPLLFAADGAEAFGVDVEVPTYHIDFQVLLKILRTNGVDRALKSLGRHVLFDKRFFEDLKQVCGLHRLPFSRIHIEVTDASTLSFPENYFNLTFSFGVLEHVANVEATVQHINDTLKSDGVGVITVHLFPSLSGGHCMDWRLPDSHPSRVVPPWDHLLENKYPINTFLNKLRLQDYRNIFEKYTVIEDEALTKEGESMLHLAPDSLLEEYTKEDLITGGVRFIIRKKALKSRRRNCD